MPAPTRTWKDRLRDHPALFHAAKAAQESARALRRAAWSLGRRGTIAAYLGREGFHGLQIGAGHHPAPGWLATDLDPGVAPGIIFLDVTRPFPFPDGAFDAVHSEHLIEHVPLAAGRRMLAECRRILRPGGVLRIATPDLARLAGLLRAAPPLEPVEERYVRWIAEFFLGDAAAARPVDVVNHAVRAWGHVFLYDEATLRAELAGAGFGAIVRQEVNASERPRLAGLETHADTVGEPALVAWEALVLEAERPAQG